MTTTGTLDNDLVVLLDSTPIGSQKARNLRRDPRAVRPQPGSVVAMIAVDHFRMGV